MKRTTDIEPASATYLGKAGVIRGWHETGRRWAMSGINGDPLVDQKSATGRIGSVGPHARDQLAATPLALALAPRQGILS